MRSAPKCCWCQIPLAGTWLILSCSAGSQDQTRCKPRQGEEKLHCLLAMHQGIPYQELPALGVPGLYHMDDCVALARRESGVMEGRLLTSAHFIITWYSCIP